MSEPKVERGCTPAHPVAYADACPCARVERSRLVDALQELHRAREVHGVALEEWLEAEKRHYEGLRESDRTD